MFGQGTVVLTAYGLGAAFGLGLGLAFMSDMWDFGLYMAFHSFFHLWEYMYVALFHSNELSFNSFLLNHSPAFYFAWGILWTEYLGESLIWPGMKGNVLFVIIGFLLCFGGQTIRTLAMYTAGTNFHHQIREEKEKGHKLVTFGVYQYLRHPAYFGWFWWSIGLPILVCNPISLIVFAYASWRFFSDRIPDEESTLIQFFGDDYKRYTAQTPVGIPFIK